MKKKLMHFNARKEEEKEEKKRKIFLKKKKEKKITVARVFYLQKFKEASVEIL